MTEERQPTRFPVWRCEQCGFVSRTVSIPCPIHGTKLERLLVVPASELDKALAENERLRVLIEPQEWKGWDQIDSIYEEARLLRRERDKALAALRRLGQYHVRKDSGQVKRIVDAALKALDGLREPA